MLGGVINKSRLILLCLSLVIALFGASFAFAQVNQHQGTSSGTLPSCNKLAIYELRQCLAASRSNDNQHCWTDSHLAYQECHFAMTNSPTQGGVEQVATKAELKKVQKLSKKVRAKTIKVLLMGAANADVYKRVVAQSTQKLNVLSGLKGVSDKQRQQSNARAKFYGELLNAVDKQIPCAELKSHMAEFAQQYQQAYSHNAYREIKNVLPIYCRLTSN